MEMQGTCSAPSEFGRCMRLESVRSVKRDSPVLQVSQQKRRLRQDRHPYRSARGIGAELQRRRAKRAFGGNGVHHKRAIRLILRVVCPERGTRILWREQGVAGSNPVAPTLLTYASAFSQNAEC